MNESNLLENYLNCPRDFPLEEFNEKLIKILEKNPLEIKEKVLQDHIYDILDKKGILLGSHIYKIFNTWPETIERVMLLKKNIRSDLNPENYVSLQST